ncbi:hypothetical protein GQ53DRAFT_814720 [Thozetella sp. PMI_491]|nr:hypothetical protein GQ53DRAFT_814720 [Thozetella sp. PMI_491]
MSQAAALVRLNSCHNLAPQNLISELDNNELRRAIENYASNTGESFWSGPEQASWGWQEVLNELEKARDSYNEKGNRIFARRMFRNGSGISRNVMPLLEGIPDENGLGILKGGLIIIFKAVKRRCECCEKIFEIFERIPEVLEQARRYRELHPTDDHLAGLIGMLYKELVKSIPALIRILLRQEKYPLYKKFGKAIAGDPVAEVEALLKPLRQSEKDLDTWIVHLSRVSIEKVQASQERLATTVESQVEFINTIATGIHSLAADINEIRQSQAALASGGGHFFLSIYQMVQEHLRQGSLGASRDMLAIPAEDYFFDPPYRSPRVEDTVQPNTLFGRLASDEEELTVADQDLCTVLRKQHSFTEKALSRATFLMDTDIILGYWLSPSDSNLLLVNGHMQENSVGKISAMSVFCAFLVESLRGNYQNATAKITQNIVLCFFCGEHVAPEGSLPGPQGLIRSLIIQLLIDWPAGLPNHLENSKNILATLNFTEALELPISTLCNLFGDLLGRLSSSVTVYCIIDGLSQFDTSLYSWNLALWEVVEYLQALVDDRCCDPDHRAPIKILLVSAGKTLTIHELIPSDQHVILRASNSHPRSQPALVMKEALEGYGNVNDPAPDMRPTWINPMPHVMRPHIEGYSPRDGTSRDNRDEAFDGQQYPYTSPKRYSEGVEETATPTYNTRAPGAKEL